MLSPASWLQFLVLARDSSVGETYGPGSPLVGTGTPTPGSVYRSVDLIDISGATNIAGPAYNSWRPRYIAYRSAQALIPPIFLMNVFSGVWGLLQ